MPKFLRVAAWLLLVVPGFAALAEELPVAIKGYDTVAYFADGHPEPGLPSVDYVWDEHRYLFATDEHRRLFAADPVHYLPQFGDVCSMALTRGEIHEANPENWLISGGKLYLFGEPFGPDVFRQDVTGNIKKAGLNRDLIPN